MAEYNIGDKFIVEIINKNDEPLAPYINSQAKNVTVYQLKGIPFMLDADTLSNFERFEERKNGKWIPVTSRPMDEEERAEWSANIGYDIEDEDAIIFTSQLPDDGEEVLTCDRYGNVSIDTFNNDPDYGCYFEDSGDMDSIVAWMPKPKPYKPPKEES